MDEQNKKHHLESAKKFFWTRNTLNTKKEEMEDQHDPYLLVQLTTTVGKLVVGTKWL